MGTTSITAKTLVITKHFNLIFLQHFWYNFCGSWEEGCLQQKGIQNHLGGSVLFLHHEKLSAGALFTCLWHCQKRWGFCRSLLVAKFQSFSSGGCPKHLGSFTWCVVHQYTHRTEVFYCVLALIWVSVPRQHTMFTNQQPFIRFTFPY